MKPKQEQTPCPHNRFITATRGERTFTAGAVYDDIEYYDLCIDCFAELPPEPEPQLPPIDPNTIPF